ncbi:MAG: STAS/SEC14 domain-containing protein [Planctomycetes bacterium]|nr:STAS/SEC14 domain-containing protein [Planctomycetota bacterium]
MLHVQLDRATKIAKLEPAGALEKSDFEAAAKLIDPFIEQCGSLHGLIIHTQHFPGWNSFAAFLGHLRFVRDHHHLVKKIAMVTDSPIGNLAESIGDHFVAAEVRHFPFDREEEARNWILG